MGLLSRLLSRRAGTVGAGLGVAGGTGLAAITNAAASPSQQDTEIDAARRRVQEMEAEDAIFSNTGDDPEAVRAAQSRLAARGFNIPVDGRMGPKTANAIREHRQVVRAELDLAREDLAKIEQAENWSTASATPGQETLRHIAPYLGVGAGLLLGHGARAAAVKAADASLLKRMARVNALVERPGPIPAGRSGKAAVERAQRVANVNEFWRMGGAGKNVPFTITERGRAYVTKPNPTDMSELYKPAWHENAWMRPGDLAMGGAGGAEAAISTGYLEEAKREEAAAQEAVDNDPSVANIRRLESARDAVAGWTAAQRLGLGFATGAVGGAAFHRYGAARPNFAAAEREIGLLSPLKIAPKRKRAAARVVTRRRRALDEDDGPPPPDWTYN